MFKNFLYIKMSVPTDIISQPIAQQHFLRYGFSLQNYVKHDLKTWGPRTALQRDSYSWTDKEKMKLQDMRSSTNSVSGKGWKLDPYIKLPPIVGSSINDGKCVAKNEVNLSKPMSNGIHHFNAGF